MKAIEKSYYLQTLQVLCCVCLLFMKPQKSIAQISAVINMATIDGMPITPDNVFGYQIHATKTQSVTIKGSIRYKGSQQWLSYVFHSVLNDGVNTFSPDWVNATWQFSSPALKDVFFTHKILPAGTYEYCVSIVPDNVVVEMDKQQVEECLYRRGGDLFLINLVDPADKSKIKEFNPMLSWVANYSVSNELSYRIRVAEIKQGQNAVNAVMRNQQVYDERNLAGNSIIYPTYARPLVVNQPYAWTVDAYYKGVLLGGAETWQFIITDTQSVTGSSNRSYIDVRKENGTVLLTAIGNLKLKYLLDEQQNDTLYLEITNDNNKHYSVSPKKLAAVYGDNRYTLDLAGTSNLKHKSMYNLLIHTKTGHEYKLRFQYFNPDFDR